MRGLMVLVRKVASVLVIGVAGVFVVAAVALLAQGQWGQLVTVALSAGVGYGGWWLWPRRNARRKYAETRSPQQARVGKHASSLIGSATGVQAPREARQAVARTAHPRGRPPYPTGMVIPATVPAADFVAVDVETANADHASVCAIAVARVRGGIVVGQHAWLVQPPAGHDVFLARNVGIHGITADRVAREGRPWPQVLAEVMQAIGTDVVVAHNASFDMSVVQAATRACGLAVPAIKYADSLALARRKIPGLASYALPALASACGIMQVHHHDAGDDARVCAEITARLLAVSSPEPASESRSPDARHGRGHSLPPNPDADASHPLYGVFVSITGELSSMTRTQARERLARVGANHRPNVSRKTTYLVRGAPSGAELTSSGGQKLLMAKAMQADGYPIQVITEEAFLELLDGRPASSPKQRPGGLYTH